MSSLLSLQEENRILQQELSRLEDLLAQSRAERDELAIKYNAISERVGRLPARPHKSTPFGPKTHLPSISERCRGAHNVPVMETSAPGVLGLVLRDAQSIPVPPPWCSPRCLLFCTVVTGAERGFWPGSRCLGRCKTWPVHAELGRDSPSWGANPSVRAWLLKSQANSPKIPKGKIAASIPLWPEC